MTEDRDDNRKDFHGKNRSSSAATKESNSTATPEEIIHRRLVGKEGTAEEETVLGREAKLSSEARRASPGSEISKAEMTSISE